MSFALPGTPTNNYKIEISVGPPAAASWVVLPNPLNYTMPSLSTEFTDYVDGDSTQRLMQPMPTHRRVGDFTAEFLFGDGVYAAVKAQYDLDGTTNRFKSTRIRVTQNDIDPSGTTPIEQILIGYISEISDPGAKNNTGINTFSFTMRCSELPTTTGMPAAVT
jgi:hypothetical protein